MAIVLLALLALANARSDPRFPEPYPFQKQRVDCFVKYSDWSPCSVPCGPGGFQVRFGEIIEQAKYGGRECPSLRQQRTCFVECAPPPPVDCQVWYGEWSQCSKNCGGGSRTRNGQIEVEPKNGGAPCPALVQRESCNQNECDTPRKDCQVWFGEWSQCSVSCNGGTQWRKGLIEVNPENGGKPCPELTQEQSCNQFQCDVPNRDCEVTFSEWSECSKPCGGGFQWSRGRIVVPQQGNGKPCPPLEREQSCSDHSCTTAPINCKVKYSEWTPCSQPCGGGISRQWGRLVQNPENGGSPCPQLEKERTCNEHLCDIPVIDCKVRYSSWSECSLPCGGGTQRRYSKVIREASNGGIPCPHPVEEQSCNEQPCLLPQNCKLWFPEWSACSKSCGAGIKQRNGLIEIAPQNGGKPCPPVQQQQKCNEFECDAPSVNCRIQFARWSECSQPCGGGLKWRSGVVVEEPVGAGKPCPPAEQLQQEAPCNEFECTPQQPQDCLVQYSPWSGCSKPCGGGIEQRWGKVTVEQANGGKPCPELEQKRTCKEHLCTVPVVDCQFQYSDFSQCSASCGGGTKKRYVTIFTQPKNGGAPCPGQVEEIACNEDINCVPEVVDCLTIYTEWTPCSKLCGGGTRQRWGDVKVQPSPGGAPCGPLEQSEACNTKLCSPTYGYRRRY